MPNSELVFPVMCHFTNFPNGGCQLRREPEQTKYLNRVFLLNCQAPKQSNLGGAEWESIHISVILFGFYELKLFLEAWSEKGSNFAMAKRTTKMIYATKYFRTYSFCGIQDWWCRKNWERAWTSKVQVLLEKNLGAYSFFLIKKAPSSSVPSSSNCFSD